MKVIGVVGLPASGKGEFSRIARDLGIPVVVMGDVIRRAVSEAGLPETDENMGRTASNLRLTGGMDAIARLSIPAIEAQISQVVVVDGIRGDAEVELFRTCFPRFFLVGIESGFDLRLERLVRRGRSDATCSREELLERDRREMGWGLGKALERADYLVSNDCSLPEFEKTVKGLLLTLGSAT
ncbi:MAG: flagellar hook-basal body complex protein FliE [Methanoregulaceae archaeon]|nr:flagellar hook-basal body complex protein FliE [Methanoregulaceae archaeon]